MRPKLGSYKPNLGSNARGAHIIALQTLGFTLGLDPNEVEHFLTLRGKRHNDFYKGMRRASPEECREAVARAVETLKSPVACFKRLMTP
jgi:hypothetical protein